MRVLEGIKVIDLTMWAFVPSCGGVLAHWGADVIKVESPRACDPMRTFGGTTEPDGASWMFKHYNRGKRAITLDLTTAEGKDVLYRLIEDADVFLTSFLTPTRQRLGFDVDQVRARNARIVYAKGTGQGPVGGEADKGGYDGATWWHRGGIADGVMQSTGMQGYPPGMVGHGDGMSGLALAGGICAALVQRERTGEAEVVDGSLLGTAMWFMGPAIITSTIGQTFGTAGGDRLDREPLMNSYRTADDRYIMVNTMGGDEDWIDLVTTLGRPDMATGDRFVPAANRTKNRGEAVAILDEVFATKTLEEWKSELASTRAVWAPTARPGEVANDPQAIANGFIRQVEYPSGPLSLVAPPVLFGQDAYAPERAPDFNEHTDEVLSGARYSAEDVARLRKSGVIG